VSYLGTQVKILGKRLRERKQKAHPSPRVEHTLRHATSRASLGRGAQVRSDIEAETEAETEAPVNPTSHTFRATKFPARSIMACMAETNTRATALATAAATAAERLLRLAVRVGAKQIFVNWGSDHPAFIEAFASLHASGEAHPRVIVCPHEMTALSAAHGYAMITREPQLVLVHVDVGTANLGGSVHNAARGRVPAIVLAGKSPVTDAGDRIASRTEFIHYIQDSLHQDSLVQSYAKWCYELRAGEMTEKILLRGRQLAVSEPQGVVYITGAREFWEEPGGEPENPDAWRPAQLEGLSESSAREIAAAVQQAKRPLIITSYLGRNPAAVERLVQFAQRAGVGVCEVVPQYLNFPASDPHHLGFQMNRLVDEADCILLLDVDVPWIPSRVQPAPGAAIFHIDCDPLKESLGYWHFPARRVWRADTATALDQLLRALPEAAAGRDERAKWIASVRPKPPAPQVANAAGEITREELTHAVRALLNERSLVLMEYPTGVGVVQPILALDRPGSFFASGGSSLGWGINAAIGAKLARPEAEVIALVGDGCYQYGVPSSAYWTASACSTPFLTVIYNNGGWQSPKYSADLVHPDGPAKRNDFYWTTASAGAKLADVAAAAGNAAAFTVREGRELVPALHEAMRAVRAGRSAVVDVAITRFSAQAIG
jgi:acetolactate synthase I/II/III large subunit